MKFDVFDVLVFAGERFVAVPARQARFGDVAPLVGDQVALNGELFVAYFAAVRSQAGVNTFVGV